MYHNPFERYAISDRTPGLKFGDDGSLTLTIGYAKPEEKANWWPAPKGAVYLVIRLYGAKLEEWNF